MGYGDWPNPGGFEAIAEWVASPRRVSAIREAAAAHAVHESLREVIQEGRALSALLSADRADSVDRIHSRDRLQLHFREFATVLAAAARSYPLPLPDELGGAPTVPPGWRAGTVDGYWITTWLEAIAAANTPQTARLKQLLREVPQAGRHHATDESEGSDEPPPRTHGTSDQPTLPDQASKDGEGATAPAKTQVVTGSSTARDVAVLAVVAMVLAMVTPLIPGADELASRYCMWLALLLSILALVQPAR
jgi:hypothetical protein